MRLVVDLLACQTDSRFRGIGRYTHSLVTEMAQSNTLNQMFALANAGYEDSFEVLRREFTRILPAGGFLPYQHPEVNAAFGEKDPNFEIASSLLHHAYETLSPDFVLYPSIFEGWGEKGVVPLPRNGFPSALKSVIIYDFIPFIFADRFIDRDPYFKEYYLRRLNVLKKFDLLLAISESTRQDAIRILDLPPERVVNISAAASSIFQQKEYSKMEIQSLHRRFGITKPFVFYTGNVEYHKNMETALRAYSMLPDEVRRNHQFVLTHTGDETAFRNRIRTIGLDDSEIAITGHIADDDLVALYNSCALYVFPSLYEGFGLPILEAMACGAPVIASNNSSIPEVMGREDAMFDASDERGISIALYKVLTDENLRQDLSAYGLNRVKQFSWKKSAEKAWSAMEDVLEKRYHDRTAFVSIPAKKLNLRIAYVSPVPPDKTGIADYSVDLLPYLSRYVDIDLFVEPGMKDTSKLPLGKQKIFPWTELVDRQEAYDSVIYQIGNSKYHRHMFDLLRKVPGIVVLHDFYLSHIREYLYSTQYIANPSGDFYAEVGDVHGLFGMVDMHQRGINRAIWDWPLNWNVLKYAQKIIVHSNYQSELTRKFYGHGWTPQITVIPQLHRTESGLSASEKDLKKQQLGIVPESFTICSFGFLNPTKLNMLTVEAFASYLFTDPQATLVFVGETDREEFERLQQKVDQLGISERVKVTGFVDQETFRSYLSVADAAVQLRVNSRGETSRAVLDCMAFGIPTIINAHGSLNDYDSDWVIKLQEFPAVEELAAAMVKLNEDRTLRETIGQNARAALDTYHHPEKVAAGYFAVIQEAVRTSNRELFAPLVDAIVKNGSENGTLQAAAGFAAANMSLRNNPRILVDVTNIAFIDLRSGIQRVVKNLIRGFYALQDPAIHLEMVRIQEGTLYRAARFAEKLFTLPEQSLGQELPIILQPGDQLFMLDTSWNLFDQFLPVFDRIRKGGGRIVTMLYDMIPVKFPAFCSAPRWM